MMMSQDRTLAKLKKDVRSLLLSSKLGLSAEQLRKDYVCMLGQRMPLKELGFRSILDMAKEMPEVVSFIYLEDGSFVLKAVSDESTEGINQLVSKQRLTKPKNKRGYLMSFPMRYPRPMAPIILPRWGRAPPALPAQLRSQLRQLISQGPLRLSELERRFQQCFGHPLRYTDYGFYSLGDMLARVPDLCILYTRMGSVVSFKQPEQPGPQSRPQSPKTESVKPEAIRPSPCLFSSLNPKTGLLQPGQSSAPSQCSPSQRTTSATQNSLVPSCKSWDPISNGSERVPDNGPPHQPTGPEPQQPYQDGQLLEKFMFKLETELRQKILENGYAGSVSPELKDKLQQQADMSYTLQVVRDHSQGLSVHDLPTHYKRVFREELPVLQSGFLSVTQLVAALSDVFHLEPAGGTKDPHWIVKNLSNKHTESECGGEEGRRREGCLYQSIRRSLWEQHEDDDKEEKEDQPDPTTCLTSFLTNQQLVELYPAVQVRSNSMVPLDAVRAQRLRPPTRRWPRALAAVLVEQVESPGSFHVRFSESQEARSLEDMMMEMRGCYNSSGVAARYRLPERYLRPGQVCCVAPRDLWFYRVVVQRVLSPDQVEVYYVDFGDLNLVSVDKLMFLKSCYSQLPTQAVPAMLTGVQPISGDWSAVATASFQSLCSDRTLVAVLHGYHGDALQLLLCDTHTEDDRYVHSVLLEQGHARPCCPPGTTGGVRDHLKSLYLREALINLEDEEENATTTITPQPITGQHCQYSVLEEESLSEPPGLELVEAFHNSNKTLNLCESWLKRNRCSEGDQTWASGGSVEDLRPPNFTKLPELAADHQPIDLPCVSQAPPLICNGNLATTLTSSEEDSRPGVDPAPAVTPDACRAPMTSPVSSLPPILSLSLLTPGLAKGCFYGIPGTSLRSTGPAMSFPLFGGRSVAIASRKCD
ncbi:tudor domain-containing protein 5 isoform X2 [Gadus macrocephalus]|uniref:tudor domain-containing protein 5 isoform X2 n=1 Tax=Gadus macrocephalus TaxID=80720 RepID=UPI0028CB3CDC|nr:tudor domain-containing protein 5 isoform X2 [Gadus macrocephalus]